MSLLDEVDRKAMALGIPLNAQLDITWRCNERCVHCYLDHEGAGEMTTAEIKDAIRQMHESGTFFLSVSGGEPLLRRDCFEILEYARSLRMSVKLKTNATMIGPKEAARIRELGIGEVQISLYSHEDEVHDTITKLPGSLRRTIEGIRNLTANDVKVSISNVLMTHNAGHGLAVKQLADELGVIFHIDPTITPKLDGDRSILSLNISENQLEQAYHTEEFVGNVGEFCAPASSADTDYLDNYSCSAGHTYVYISPTGEVWPCVQFPMKCGSLREQKFGEIWRNSPAFTELRSVHLRDMPTCSQCNHASYCSRCPGLAYVEGDLRGPSSKDCRDSFVRTGIPVSIQTGTTSRVAQGAYGLVQIAAATGAGA
jgi:radical SAM protein with 4Fe4S-binding SPASM domain